MQRKRRPLLVAGIFSLALLLLGLFAPAAVAEGKEPYFVRAGDTMASIAAASGASVDLLAAMNNVSPTVSLRQGQLLYLPRDPEITVLVAEGDTAASIAEKYNVSEALLLSYNGLFDPYAVKQGVVLAVPVLTGQEEPQSLAVQAAAYQEKVWRLEVRQVRISSRSGTQKIRWQLPLKGIITSDYGWRASGFHHGVDIAADVGAPIVAASSGEVIEAGYRNSIYGKVITISHLGGYTTMYAHLSNMEVSPGDWVWSGQTIGEVGETGNATGPHLHFQMTYNDEIVNPNRYLSFK